MGIALVALVGLLLLGVAAFPWGLLDGIVKDRLAERFGRPVVVGAVEREDAFGFHPVVVVRDIRVAQAQWAGRGDLVRVKRIRIGFSVWPLLTGSLKPQSVEVDGLRLAMVRTRDGRTNWDRPGGGGRGGAAPDLRNLVVRDAVLSYRDAKRDRSVEVRIASDAQGVRAEGRGIVRKTPVTLTLRGASVQGQAGRRWPFAVAIEGPALAMRARGATDVPLDTDHMTLDVDARADDLRLIDAIVEAGLFGTQPVTLSAHVRHAGPVWRVTGLRGTVGRSQLSGRITVDKSGGRSAIDGDLTAPVLDFADLSSDEGQAKAAALEARIGPRLVPNTRVNLSKIGKTDGQLRVHANRIVNRKGSSALTSLKATVTLDHRRLTLAPLTIGLRQGTIAGRVVVDQRDGAPEPLVRINLRLTRSSISALGGGGPVNGSVTANAAIVGRGSTLREAVGNGDGRIGLFVRDGVLPVRYAAALGFDVGRAVLSGGDSRAGLRCAALRLRLTGGRGRVDPLVIDTTASQARGSGTVTFPQETLAIRMSGQGKHGSVLRVPGSVTITGPIRTPHLTVPPAVRSPGSILKAIGRAVTGDDGGSHASEADCNALSKRVLG